MPDSQKCLFMSPKFLSLTSKIGQIYLFWHWFPLERQYFNYRKSKSNSDCLLPYNLVKCMRKSYVYKSILNKDMMCSEEL